MARQSKFDRFLEASNVPLLDFLRAQQFFADRKISLGYNSKRDAMTFMGFFVDAPIPCIYHCGPGPFREHMDAPNELITEMRQQSIEALAHYQAAGVA